MNRRLLSLMALVFLIAPASCAARPVVGVLPFQSEGSGGQHLTYAAAGLISWELFGFAGIDQIQMRRLERARQIDRLRRPRSLEDPLSWSSLARGLGVDYVITGSVRASRGGTLSLEICAFPADPTAEPLRLEDGSPIRQLPALAARAARSLAEALGGQRVGQDVAVREEASTEALKALDSALRLQMAPDGDRADIHASFRVLQDAVDDPGVGLFAWALRVIPWARGDREIARDLMRRAPDNLMVLSEMALRRLQIGVEGRGRAAIVRWTAADPESYLARIAEAASLIPETELDKQRTFAGLRRMLPKQMPWRMKLASAEVLAAAGDLQGAAELIRRAKLEKPRSAYVHVVAAQIYLGRGRFPAGRAEYEAAAEKNPDSYLIQIGLAGALFQEGRTDRALELAERIRERWPDRSEGHELAARLYLRKGEQDLALEAYEKVRMLDPDGGITSEDLASFYLRSGRVLDAVREITRGREDVRRILVVSSLILTGVFLAAAVGVAFAVRAALRRDRGGT